MADETHTQSETEGASGPGLGGGRSGPVTVQVERGAVLESMCEEYRCGVVGGGMWGVGCGGGMLCGWYVWVYVWVVCVGGVGGMCRNGNTNGNTLLPMTPFTHTHAPHTPTHDLLYTHPTQ